MLQCTLMSILCLSFPEHLGTKHNKLDLKKITFPAWGLSYFFPSIWSLRLPSNYVFSEGSALLSSWPIHVFYSCFQWILMSPSLILIMTIRSRFMVQEKRGKTAKKGLSDREKSVIRWPTGLKGEFQSLPEHSPSRFFFPPSLPTHEITPNAE